jgi:hypothetical protein
LGEEVASMLLAEAEKMPDAYPLIRRVNVLAMKTRIDVWGSRESAASL